MGTLSTTARNAALDAAVDLLDGGAGTYPTMRFQTVVDADLMVVNLDTTAAAGTAAAGAVTLNPPDGEGTWVNYEQTPTAAGTVDHVILTNRAATEVIRLSVGVTASGEEVILPSLSFTTSQAIRFTAAPTITQIATYDPTP